MKKIIYIILLFGILAFYFVTNRNELSNDYYDYINREFFDKNYLGENDYTYSTFTKAQDESDEVIYSIVMDVVDDKIEISNNVDDKIKILYNNVIDYDTRNRVGLGPLKSYIDLINSSNNIYELVNNSVVVERELGVDIFTRIAIDSDFVDNSHNIVYLYPVTFAFGASADYFVDEDYMVYKAYIKRSIINLLEKYGYSRNEARLVSSEVISFYSSISECSKLSSSYVDVTSYYNIVDNDILSDVYKKFDVVSYLSSLGINKEEYSLVDEGQYRKINEYLTDDYLLVWKKVILIKILSSYASYLDEGYRDIVVDLNNSLTGSNDRESREDEAISIVSNVFSDDLDKIYENRVITGDDKNYLSKLFYDIKKSFRKMLEGNVWLSDETKKKALVKLDNMKVYVGVYGDNCGDYIEVNGNSLVSDIISINRSNYLKSLARLDKKEEVKAISEKVVNAYYNPMTNAVYIPSSVMFLLKNSESYFERLGTIGIVIAHEITHGFDYNGSMFDNNGNLNNWWNDTDRDKYSELVSIVSQYYSKIEVIDGRYINGDRTVNENIADMGALEIITNVAIKNRASNEDLKVMYSSFADFWKSQETEEYTKLLLLSDSHSPNKYRVNAVLSLIDKFYDVYNIYPWNDMYIFNRDRVSVW